MTDAEIIETHRLIELLVEDEPSQVAIVNPNQDWDGSNRSIGVVGEWTDYKERRFDGDTLLDAVQAAHTAMMEVKQ